MTACASTAWQCGRPALSLQTLLHQGLMEICWLLTLQPQTHPQDWIAKCMPGCVLFELKCAWQLLHQHACH